MTRKALWVVAALAAVAVWVVATGPWSIGPADPSAAGSQAAPVGTPPAAAAASAAASLASAIPTPGPGGPGEPRSALESMTLPSFHADAQGRLRRDAHTRVGVERIVALFEPVEALDTLARQSAALPPAAQRELTDLYHRYVQYSQALASSLPPASPDGMQATEAWAQFEALKQLRRQHFGDEGAQSMFGDEERMAAQWLRQMGSPAPPPR